MGGEFIADEDGTLALVVEGPDGSPNTLVIDGFDAGEEVYATVKAGRFR